MPPALSRTLNLQVTAEGIKHADQLRQLQLLGCDCGQGYYFARPLAREQVASLFISAVQQEWPVHSMPLMPIAA